MNALLPEVSGLVAAAASVVVPAALVVVLKGALLLLSIADSLISSRSFSDAEEREFGFEAKEREDLGSGESLIGVTLPIDAASSSMYEISYKGRGPG